MSRRRSAPRRLAPVVVMLLVLAGGVFIASLRSRTEVPASRSVEDRSDNPLSIGNDQPAPGPLGPQGPPAQPGGQGAGAPRGAGGGAGPGAQLTLHQGVSEREITILAAIPSGTCDPAVPRDDADAEAVAAAVDYLNLKGAAGFGGPVSTDFNGRRLRLVQAADHGDSGECAARSREEALRAMSAHRPFVVVGGGRTWDEVVTAQRAVKATAVLGPGSYYSARRPYLFGTVTSGSFLSRFLAGYVTKSLKNSNSIATGDPATSDRRRSFAIFFPAEPVSTAVADDLRRRLRDKDVRVDGPSFASYDPAPANRSASIAGTAAALKSRKVTTVLLLGDRPAVAELAAAADREGWRPEWITTTAGSMDDPDAVRRSMSVDQRANAFGVSTSRPSRGVRVEDSAASRAWREVRPGDPPESFEEWYRQLRLVAIGLARAGEALTPQSFATGLQAGCSPCPGSNPRDPLVGFGPRDPTGVDDGHRQRFDEDRPDVSAPRSQWRSGRPPRGSYAYESGGRRVKGF